MSRVCFDRILPRDLLTAPLPASTEGQTPRAAFERRKLWELGRELKVAFLDGSSAQHDLVRRFAPEWSRHGRIKFDFVHNSTPDIRITFDETDGSWSFVGNDATTIHKSKPTMNFGWLDEAVVLHEFGHAIGMIHEHENPLGGIKWNREAVYRDLGGPPNNWDRKTVDNNMFSVYARNQVNATEVDKLSIMLYEVPKSWTSDGFSSEPNAKLSDGDKAFIGHEKNYPLTGARKS